MAEKCRKAKGATLERCEAAQYAISNGFIHLQHMRNWETGALRERLALKKGKEWAPLHFCPWCRANIDTRPTGHKEKPEHWRDKRAPQPDDEPITWPAPAGLCF